jgi:hypothetical protein
LIGKSEGGKRLLKPSHRWEDNIKMNLKGAAWEVVSTIMKVQAAKPAEDLFTI